ncbi:1-aminocyclopropane-1-carboxylate deaminase [Sulfurimonas sp. SAG-AH-194-L11]|nr:1-aminocyclopropane-1-carboxylate deaminase [Sulfurimonas sp. SAG-AH-194-L11]MDF1876503.1 1-aminocyclopropane-1-carboxylate deaminase [Sulfurimonas sp. SAG-AH-194-L11]
MKRLSAISKITLDGREFFIKRDEMIDPYLSGNKYRKLYTLLQTPKTKFTKVISYGGTQSNAMLALAAICKKKGWEFIYYTKTISAIIKDQKFGNYYEACSFGMQSIELEYDLYKEYISALRLGLDEKTLLIDQGGADVSAKEGLEVLADELREQLQEEPYSGIKALATPSGTGTTALYLALSLPEYTVYTTPCIGSVAYLKEQMHSLHTIPKNLIILEPKKKYHFAKLYDEFFDMYKKVQEAGVEFDLLYAPAMWLALLESTQESILYIHSGGLTGNRSMLKRYQRRR